MTDAAVNSNQRAAMRRSVSATPSTGFQVPTSTEAERSVLGSIFLKPELLEETLTVNLRPEDFYLEAHRVVFRRILDLALSSQPIDIVSVAEELQDHNELDVVRGYAYLSELIDLAIPERKHVLHHSAIVKKKAMLRGLQVVGERSLRAAGAPGADPIQLGQQLVDEIGKILERAKNDLQNSRN